MLRGADPTRWDDLRVRLGSGAAMVVIGTIAILAGGVWFQMLAVFCVSVMIWELWIMIHPSRPTVGMLLAALTASVLSGFLSVEQGWFLLFFPIVPALGILGSTRERLTFGAFAFAIQAAGWGLVVFRHEQGAGWLIWLILVVAVTDIAGYFAGRRFGGPKFWPKVSPKKTWSGTIAGWIGAGLVGAVFWAATEAGPILILLSMFISFAGQMGDIAESALKRRMGVKDSSTLIPGHGGLFDRFDALLGAAVTMLLISAVFDVPGVGF
ncbi:phosphatidate cytidylyltransferase [Histidinibacterium aquaticum]|uniref:Phosphatidate cytidylyltransferase n=1 Tax=Histidinibacterium aquaticum TaxID=2613962 RepID=A0A5J5GKC9_9RHOB|nr:phosphatidate cytidylyltransferase [Histidinibacterium aquaticum]KAA9008729.1 phosphatidate cytidylyltransferase [Histidinibacterium aquaticum]